MKKLTTLLLAAGLVVSSFAGASAAEFKPKAQFINQYSWLSSGDSDIVSTESFMAAARTQIGFDFIASENLSATFLVRVAHSTGGGVYYGDGEFDASYPSSINVRLAYIDWMVPNTQVQVRMGYQPVALPAFAFGSAVIDARGSGITVSAPINDNFSVAALWTRMSASAETATISSQYADLFAVVADANFDGFRVAPWLAYGNVKLNSTENAESGYNTLGDLSLKGFGEASTAMWLVGASLEVSMFDPFMFAMDAYYSNVSVDPTAAGSSDYDADGFFVGAALSYKAAFGTPALKAWYASGNDEKSNGDDFIGVAYLAPCFGATSIMFDNYVMGTGPVELANGASPSGTWGVLLEVADVSFVEKLSHQFIVAYIEGTNEANNGVGSDFNDLGTKDSVIEVNFNSTYQIYKNLSTTLQLGWLAPSFDAATSANDMDDDILRAALSFTYNF